jgi:hypothetical protein
MIEKTRHLTFIPLPGRGGEEGNLCVSCALLWLFNPCHRCSAVVENGVVAKLHEPLPRSKAQTWSGFTILAPVSVVVEIPALLPHNQGKVQQNATKPEGRPPTIQVLKLAALTARTFF